MTPGTTSSSQTRVGRFVKYAFITSSLQRYGWTAGKVPHLPPAGL
jgi:hypothetical protein